MQSVKDYASLHGESSLKERNTGASVRARLLTLSKERKEDFNFVLTRYALERLLYRLSISNYSRQFLLKGALLFEVWFDIPHRPTRDADLLGFGSSEQQHIEAIFREICSIREDDGVDFQIDTVRATEIRKDAGYAGVRVTFIALIDGSRSNIQVDIGFGDAVTPSAEEVEYPVMLSGFKTARLGAYPKYTVVAEKVHALTKLGMANSRLKDYFDLWILATKADFDGQTLNQAIVATFDRRETPLPQDIPLGLSKTFAKDSDKNMQWTAFFKKNSLEELNLEETVEVLQAFLIPVLVSTANSRTPKYWTKGGPWSYLH
jgi:predicted nucleotidyltransferase component of viral defense system